MPTEETLANVPEIITAYANAKAYLIRNYSPSATLDMAFSDLMRRIGAGIEPKN